MQMMDLTPFFHNVERIATALETIARNGTPNTYEGESRPLLSVEAKDRILATLRGDEPKKVDTAGTEGRTRPRAWLDETKKEEIERRAGFSVLPNPLVVAGVTQGQANAANTQILGFIKRVHDEGTHTANGIANSLKARGIPHPRGLKWHNLSVKPFMDQLGLASPYGVRGGRKPKDAAVPTPQPAEPAPEPDRAPDEPVAKRRINRAFVQREFQQPRMPDAHMSMRSLLSPKTQEALEAHEKADREQRALIEAAVAAGKVTKLPACVDSNGVNHLEESGHGSMRGSSSFGPDSGSRIQARGSNN
jgi:hypothetical protein